MIHLKAAVDDLVARLASAGIPATADLRNLNPPAVYVPAPEIAWRYGKGADLTYRIVAAVPNTGRDTAIADLSRLIDRVQAALAGAITEGRPVDLTALDAGAPLPGYELTLTERIQRP